MSNVAISNIHIKLKLEGFPLLDSSRFDELIEIGYLAAQQALSNWQVDLDLS